MTVLVWFRRDLRVHDHPALRAALDRGEDLVPVFCFDDRLLGGRHASGPRTQFLLDCLADLDGSLRARGSGLVVRRGPPERELPQLARHVGARAIEFTAEISPFGRQRDERVARACEEAEIALRAHPGIAAVDDIAEIRTNAGRPFTVFSPFHRAWLHVPRREPIGAPRKLPPLPSNLSCGRIPRLEALGLEQEVAEPSPGGESPARERLRRFLAGRVRSYESRRDALDRKTTSRLSPYLHFGCVSPREVEQRLPRGVGADAFRRQLCWRDFYHHVLFHFPRNARSEFQDRYRGSIRWSHATRAFEAWKQGCTGYPLVDAGMRQLRREGWMHNRARLIAGSFLTKDLGIDWRWGERWFMRLLVDGDEANNNGNWQWVASVGVDPQPAFRRIYNPARQMERYDPDGRYVRTHVSELRDVPREYLPEPWRMPVEVQQRVGCVIGQDYPGPIVDHSQARQEALARFAEAKLPRGGSSTKEGRWPPRG
ncbi:MAG TPA: deoxyribodipyrimidine photo-lyase [Solirubrobacterales bacterium]